MRISGFFRCPCGKMHSFGGIGVTTKCTCGRLLYRIAYFGGK